MKIGFIGAGKVGTAFGMYLKEKKIEILGYYSKSFDSAKNSAKFTNSNFFVSIEQILIESKIVFITTNDDQIINVVKQIKKYKKINTNKIYIHMSGSLSTEIFDTLRETNSAFYSLHPLASFANENESVKNLENAVITVEGFGEFKEDEIVINLLKKIKNKYFLIDRKQKVKYHMAACIASNYLDSLVDISLELFSEIGIDNKFGFEALKPLIYGTLTNIEKFGTKKAITGPISRGDYKVVKNHISEINSDSLREIYKALGIKTLEISKVNKLYDVEKIKKLENLFNE